MAARRPSRLKLWWCTTEDHSEDFFVVASSARSASNFFMEDEMCDGPIHAEEVTLYPDDGKPGGGACWADDAQLEACGVVAVSKSPRAWTFGGKTYIAKSLANDMHDVLRGGDPAGHMSELERAGARRAIEGIRERGSVTSARHMPVLLATPEGEALIRDLFQPVLEPFVPPTPSDPGGPKVPGGRKRPPKRPR